MLYGHDTTDSKTIDKSPTHGDGDLNRSPASNDNATIDTKSSKTKNSKKSMSMGDKRRGSPSSLLRPISSSIELGTTNNNNNNSKTSKDYQYGSSAIPIPTSTSSSSTPSLAEKDEELTPEEQQQFQQHAMSKAISYTINSLLGNGNSSIISNHNESRKASREVKKDKGSRSKSSLSNQSSDSGASLSTVPASLFGIAEQDQNSFLRHLLDTSDPIPSSSASSSSPPSTSKLLERSAINPSNKSKSSSTSSKSKKSTKLRNSNLTPSISSNSHSNISSRGTRADPVSKVVPATPVSSSSAPTQLSPYNYLLHPQRLHHEVINYTPPTFPHPPYSHPSLPLLPPNFIPNVGTHPYLGHLTPPNFPTPVHYNGETALNLSQRGGDWSSSGLPNQSSFDRASSKPQDLSIRRRRGNSYYEDSIDFTTIDTGEIIIFAYKYKLQRLGKRYKILLNSECSCSKFNGFLSYVSDVPLNLCKKPRPS